MPAHQTQKQRQSEPTEQPTPPQEQPPIDDGLGDGEAIDLDRVQVAPEDLPAIVAYYQQQLVNEQYKVAVMSVQLAKERGRLLFAHRDVAKLEAEIEIIRGATPITNTEGQS